MVDLSLHPGRCRLPLEGRLPESCGREQPVSPQVKCCGWVSFYNWTENAELMNRTNITYPCSCEARREEEDSFVVRKGFCEAFDSNRTESGNSPEYWPVYHEVCGQLWGPGWTWGTLGSGYLGHSGFPGWLLSSHFFPASFPPFLPSCLPSFPPSSSLLPFLPLPFLHLALPAFDSPVCLSFVPASTYLLIYAVREHTDPALPALWARSGRGLPAIVYGGVRLRGGVIRSCFPLVGLHEEGAGLAAGERGHHPRHLCGRRRHRGLNPFPSSTPAPPLALPSPLMASGRPGQPDHCPLPGRLCRRSHRLVLRLSLWVHSIPLKPRDPC